MTYLDARAQAGRKDEKPFSLVRFATSLNGWGCAGEPRGIQSSVTGVVRNEILDDNRQAMARNCSGEVLLCCFSSSWPVIFFDKTSGERRQGETHDKNRLQVRLFPLLRCSRCLSFLLFSFSILWGSKDLQPRLGWNVEGKWGYGVSA